MDKQLTLSGHFSVKKPTKENKKKTWNIKPETCVIAIGNPLDCLPLAIKSRQKESRGKDPQTTSKWTFPFLSFLLLSLVVLIKKKKS